MLQTAQLQYNAYLYNILPRWHDCMYVNFMLKRHATIYITLVQELSHNYFKTVSSAVMNDVIQINYRNMNN